MRVRDGVPTSGGDAVVRTHGLTKRFRSGQVAVDGIDLEVPRGAVYGFLGPNGSGKTTTIRMLLGLVQPTSGEALVLGTPMPAGAVAVLPRVGALVEGPAFQPYLTGRKNLERLDAVDATADPRTSKARIGEALERVGLAAAAGKLYRQYSLGMKQRLGLAAALLRPRDLLVLDEPTNGLDPQGTREVRHLVRELADDGASVLVSSHLLAEIDQVCTHVGVMSRGKLLVQGERSAVIAGGRTASNRVTVTTLPDHVDRARAALARLAGTTTAVIAAPPGAGDDVGPLDVDGGVALTAALGSAVLADVAPALVLAGVPVLGIAVERPSLEDVFVELTGEGFDVAR
ncbi:multidrug ABC transporter ATP-binding protein [Serinibacter arcticus]|uniref:Multidrug ABC transporter ATP-binding protein n=1 Tax=Serinibacter arcticus TaxID=1655435 RepID=A0A2U1ZZS7_9MICO|nr:ABC transporter ATP-binding protein [Serinibacter arcticus]PWD52471.1 multidrug ABC transporter ATP-binding protein [Serinibacter arcticus]